MLVLNNRFHLFGDLQIWWPETAEEVQRLLPQSSIVTVMQCSEQVASALDPYAFRNRPFYTSIIDLRLSEQELWSRLDGQTCRYTIDKAQRLGCTVSVNEDGEQAFRFVNRFIQRRNYRRPMSIQEWRRYLEHGDVCSAKHEGRIVAAHVNLVDPPHRARLLFSARAEPGGATPQRVLHVANRYLHWSELIYYRGRGIASYDFGGIVLSKSSPLYPITQFKLSFGGQKVGYRILRLARNGGLRLALRELARVRASMSGEGADRSASSRPVSPES